MASDVQIVTLQGTPVRTTVVGFGCSNLLGNKTRKQGLHLLETAFDSGIRHFDVAPYYGFGEAEALVGEFARNKRSQITLTTKFGLEPNAQLTGADRLMSIARWLVRASPIARRIARRAVPYASRGGLFDVTTARRSLERSLSLLRTDVIDIFLMHEPVLQNCQPDLLDFLRSAQVEGKIRSFGVGGAFQQIEAICASASEFTSVVQFGETSLMRERHLRVMETMPRKQRGVITHGTFGALGLLKNKVKGDDHFRRRWEDLVAVDVSDEAAIGGLLLRHAIRMNPNGIVLFSSQHPGRVAGNMHGAGTRG